MAVNVAIFEDNRLLREMLTQLINGTQGYSCVGSFPDANNAIQKIQRAVPDVILMDIEMPGTNGIEAVRLIKEHYPAVLIIMQTVIEDNDKIFDAICAGASGYLLKNTAPARLLEAINEANAGGSPMSPFIARKVIATFQKPAISDSDYLLSPREKEVLEWLAKGLVYKEIAQHLGVGSETIKMHLKNIYKKLHVQNKIEALNKFKLL